MNEFKKRADRRRRGVLVFRRHLTRESRTWWSPQAWSTICKLRNQGRLFRSCNCKMCWDCKLKKELEPLIDDQPRIWQKRGPRQKFVHGVTVSKWTGKVCELYHSDIRRERQCYCGFLKKYIRRCGKCRKLECPNCPHYCSKEYTWVERISDPVSVGAA